MNQKDKTILIIIIALSLIFIPLLIILGEYKRLIVSLLSLFITYGLFFLISLFCFDYKKEFRKSKKYYDFIKTKEIKNVFDEFYMITFQNKAVSLFRDKLNIKNVKNIGSLGINTKNVKYINISYNYETYSVNILLSNNKIIYNIDTPYEYDYLDDTKDFEKKNSIVINIDDFKSLDEYLDMIIELINNLKNDIKVFTFDHNLNNRINGKIIKKYKSSINYLLTEGLVLFICCSFISIGFIHISIVEIDNSIEGYLAFICSILISLLCLIFSIYGIKQLYKVYMIKHDINKSRVSVIDEKPKKVKIIKDNVTRANHNCIVYLKLYYKHLTLYVLLSNQIYINNLNKIKEASLLCLEINQKIKYLSKSKIVISGGERYVSIIKDYLE